MYNIRYLNSGSWIDLDTSLSNITISPFGITIIKLNLLFDNSDLNNIYSFVCDIRGIYRNKYNIRVFTSYSDVKNINWNGCTNTTNVIPTSNTNSCYFYINIESNSKVESTVDLNINTTILPLNSSEGLMWNYTGIK